MSGKCFSPRAWCALLLLLAACDGGTRGSGIGAGFSTVTGSIAAANTGTVSAAAVARAQQAAVVVQVREFPDIQTIVDPVTNNFTLTDVPAGDITIDFLGATTASVSLHGLPEDVTLQMVNVRFVGDVAEPAGYAIEPKEGNSAEVLATPRKGAIGPHGLDVTFSVSQVSLPASSQVVWSFGDGTNSGRATTSHSYADPGIYVVEAEVQGDNATQRAFAVIEALDPGDRSLRVTAQAEPNRGLPPLNVVFSAAVENNVGATTFTWDFGDDTAPGVGQVVRHTFTQEGIFLVQVVAVDEGGNEERDVVQVQVNSGTRPVPLGVEASADPAIGPAPLQVKLHATITGSGPVSISWDFDDGSLTSSAPNPTHTYTLPGLYFATITVTDTDSGETAVAQVAIEATAP